MKLVFVLVVLTAAFTANCRDLPDGQPVLQAFTPEEQVTLDNDLTEDEQYIQNGLEEVKEHSGTEQRGKKDKKILKQLVEKLADIKIDLQTLKNHQDNNTNTNEELKDYLKIIAKHQDNITNTNDEIKEDLKIMKGQQNNITNNNKDLKVELQNIGEHQVNISNTNKDIKDTLDSVILSKLNSITANMRCPIFGGFQIGDQCFKPLRDKKRTWDDAKAACASVNLILAEPTDSNAIPLRKYVVEKYGDLQCWVGARGDGSKLVFQNSKRYILKDSTLLDYSRGSSNAVLTSNCLELDAYPGGLSRKPNSPYMLV